MSCQHQQRLGDKGKKMRGYNIFYFKERNEPALTDSAASCWVNCSGDNVVFAECHSVWAVKAGMDPATGQMSSKFQGLLFFSKQNIELFSYPCVKYIKLPPFSTSWCSITSTQLQKAPYIATHALHFSFLRIWGFCLTGLTWASLS